MKKRFKTYILLLLCMAAAACTELSDYIKPDKGDYADVTFTAITAGNAFTGTRALTSKDENHLSKVYVLIFNSKGDFRGYATINENAITQGLPTETNPYSTKTFTASFKKDSSSEKYTFVILANVNIDLSGYSITGTGTVQKSTILDDITLSEDLIDNSGNDTNYLPMWGEYTTPISLSGDVSVNNVKLLRSVAVIDIKINPTGGVYNEDYIISEVYFFNRNTTGKLVPAAGNITVNKDKATAPTQVLSRSTDKPATPATAKQYCNSPVSKFQNRLYAFESEHSRDLNSHCIIVKLEDVNFPDGQYDAYARLDFVLGGTGCPILRNYRYTFTINKIEDYKVFKSLQDAYNNPAVMSGGVTLTTADTLDGETTISSRGYYLTVNRNDFSFPPTAMPSPSDEDSKLQIKTSYVDGWTMTQTGDPAFSLVKKGTTATIPLWDKNNNGGTGITITDSYIARKTANGESYREVKYTITAGILSVTVNAHQLPTLPTNPGNASSLEKYVGAFWRKDERAERQITMPGTGRYSVDVLDYGNDFNVGDIFFAEGHPNWGDEANPDKKGYGYFVEDGTTSLFGTIPPDGLKFRIGLRTTWNSTTPRYARVLVRTGDKYQYNYILWLRQGEDPDYLYRPEDIAKNGTLASRPKAKKISPYNLTAPGYKAGSNDPYIKISARGGVFTEYPTQAGAHFQWYHPDGCIAFHPTSPKRNMPNWSVLEITSNNMSSYFWDIVKSSQEGCPSGYHRPNDGNTNRERVSSTDTELDLSEFSQSIASYPSREASIASYASAEEGFYADGYFDRRDPEVQESDSYVHTYPTSVSVNTSLVAHRGMLVYEPNRHASLFFPFAGRRSWSSYNGSSSEIGVNGSYHTSTISQDESLGRSGGYFTNSTYTSFVIMRATQVKHQYARSIRCFCD